MSRVNPYDPFWEAFRKVNRLKLQLADLAQAADNGSLSQLIVLATEIEVHLYEAIQQRNMKAVGGRD